MTDIQFDEEQQYQRPVQTGKRSLFIRLVLATGIVSTDKQAEYVLLAIAIVGITISVGIFFMGGKPATLSNTDIQHIIQSQQGAQSPTQ